ncbi:hypothetical protein [Spirosoma pulveris]
MKNTETETILAEWLSAMSHFHGYYKVLTIHVSENTGKQILASNGNLQIGQCSVDELTALLSRMKTELGKLFQHVDQINTIGEDPAKVDYKTIIGHTAVLKQLNKEAKEHLFLASLPAS